MGVEEKWREKLIDTFRTDINSQLNVASVKKCDDTYWRPVWCPIPYPSRTGYFMSARFLNKATHTHQSNGNRKFLACYMLVPLEKLVEPQTMNRSWVAISNRGISCRMFEMRTIRNWIHVIYLGLLFCGARYRRKKTPLAFEKICLETMGTLISQIWTFC